VTADLARLAAAQAKADEVIGSVAETPDGGQLLRIAVTDVATGQRLATGFVTYQVDGDRQLRLVTS
jgi:predicted homoserine dehydrogenase-like protein